MNNAQIAIQQEVHDLDCDGCMDESHPLPAWRVGDHYGIHVYEGDRPVATFHRPEDAARAVEAVHAVESAFRDDKVDEVAQHCLSLGGCSLHLDDAHRARGGQEAGQ